jgi:polyisoprenoid-binding protein YceI
MKKVVLIIVALCSLVFVFAFTLSQGWQIGDKYNITFSTDGASGIFKKFSGNILFDEQNTSTSKFDVTIDINSINTGNGMQNKDAKSSDWFDASKYPLIKYTSKKIVKTGSTYQSTGDLQMHGIIKEVVIPFTFKRNGNLGTFDAVFNINRNDFKIGKPDAEVGSIIKLTVSVPVTKK